MMWLRVLAVIASGALQAWISPPLNLWYLHWFSWVPFLWAIDRPVEAKGNFRLGWLCGIAACFTIFWWLVETIQRFSNLPTPLAMAVLGLFGLVFGAYTGFVARVFPRLRDWSGRWWPLAFAACFTCFEFINPQLFPFYQGVSMYQVAPLFQLATITGVPGVTTLILLTNAVLYASLKYLWLQRKNRPGGPIDRPVLLRWWGGLALGFALVLAYGAVRLGMITRAEENAETLRVALVQANYGVVRRFQMLTRRGGREAMLEDYLERTRSAAELGAEVVIWPEGASPMRPDSGPGQVIEELADELDIEIWMGATRHAESDELNSRGRPRLEARNTAWQISADGETVDTYDKIFLLPFGEYIPGRDLPFGIGRAIRGAIRGPGNYRPGREMKVFDGPGVRFHFLICYEAIRTLMVRRGVLAGSELLVNITFDDWFGTSSCLHQHMMLAVIQANLYGMPLVRAATTGVSVYADARGKIVHTTAAAMAENLVFDVPLVKVPTPVTWIGHLYAYLVCLATGWMMWKSGLPRLVLSGSATIAGIGLLTMSATRGGLSLAVGSLAWGLLWVGVAVVLYTLVRRREAWPLRGAPPR